MTRKDRIKTYLTGVILGVMLLIVFNMMRGASGNGGAAPTNANQPQQPAAQTEGEDAPAAQP